MPVLTLSPTFADYLPADGGSQMTYVRVTPPAPVRRGVTVAGKVPFGVLSDFPPGGTDRPTPRVVFMPGVFTDFLALVADNPKLTVRLLCEHQFGRQLADTRSGTLKLWDKSDALYWRAHLAAMPPVPVRACSVGWANSRPRLHTFHSGETVAVYERAHLLEISLVTRPAFETAARAWVVS